MTAAEARRHILEDELKRVVDLIADRYQPRCVYLFGSFASGFVRETSDIDLVVIKETPARWLDRTKELLLVTRPQAAVDFFVFTPEEWEAKKSADPFFREEVVERGRVVFGQP